MDDERVAARDRLRARTAGAGLAMAVVTGAVTGGVAGVLAEEPAGPVEEPRPRRTVYLQVRVDPAPARATAPRPPAAPPRPARQAPVTRSAGS